MPAGGIETIDFTGCLRCSAPNDYCDDEMFIFNLLFRIINVSIQTVDLINSLPKVYLNFRRSYNYEF